MTTNQSSKLTTKQRVFVYAYLSNGFNATQAAITAGYSRRWARMIAHENMTKYYIQEAIRAVLNEYGMSAAEVIARLSAHARADIGDIWDEKAGCIDWRKARAYGLTGLIKSIYRKRTRKTFPDGRIVETLYERIELHDAQNALRLLTKHYNSAPESSPVTFISWDTEAS